MIPAFNLGNIEELPQPKQQGSKSARLSERGFEHLEQITLTDLSASTKFRIGITIAYMLESSKFFDVKTVDDEVTRACRKFEGDVLENLAKQIKIKPDVLKQTVVKMKDDTAMRNEVGQTTFGILNFLDTHYKTSQIWEVPQPHKLLQDPTYRDLEADCFRVQKATPRGKLF